MTSTGTIAESFFADAGPRVEKKRVTAIDVMRGLTIALMIVVNNSGGPESYSQLQHSEWNGMTLCDLVFPFFLFIMGMTTYLSLSRSEFKATPALIGKIFRRTGVILLVCWAIHWFDNVCYGVGWLDFGRLRLTGVLTRIALCYCVVSLMALCMSRRAMVWSAAGLLVLYGALLLLFNGYANDSSNVNAVVDHCLLSEGHLYTHCPVDPEGILGTLPAIAHTVIGFCCGMVISNGRSLESRLLTLCVYGTVMVMAGLLISGLLPLNKRIWSPSYVLTTCGIAALLLATLSYVIDLKGYRRVFSFFEAFGVNPLFMYVLGEVLGVVLNVSGVTDAVYEGIHKIVVDPNLSSAIFSVSLMLAVSLVAIPLYRKRIYIKI